MGSTTEVQQQWSELTLHIQSSDTGIRDHLFYDLKQLLKYTPNQLSFERNSDKLTPVLKWTFY